MSSYYIYNIYTSFSSSFSPSRAIYYAMRCGIRSTSITGLRSILSTFDFRHQFGLIFLIRIEISEIFIYFSMGFFPSCFFSSPVSCFRLFTSSFPSVLCSVFLCSCVTMILCLCCSYKSSLVSGHCFFTSLPGRRVVGTRWWFISAHPRHLVRTISIGIVVVSMSTGISYYHQKAKMRTSHPTLRTHRLYTHKCIHTHTDRHTNTHTHTHTTRKK